jgi:hypothetical protein
MRLLTALLIALSCGWAYSPAVGRAQATLEAGKTHRWARFAPGAWSFTRETTETFGEQGEDGPISMTETTTTLKAKNGRSVTLELGVTVEIAGKRFDRPPRTVQQGFYGEVNGQRAKVEPLGSEQVTISGKRIACQMFRVTVYGEGEPDKRVSTVYFQDRIAPYELRRETVSTDLEEKTLNHETNMEVVAVNLPYPALTEVQTVAFVKTVHKSSKGKIVTLEVHCPQVPGGLIAHWSKELDESGRLLSRSVLELLDYGLTQRDEGRPRNGRLLFPRRGRRDDG